jgi:V/A-type H+-transporting ATPase subunit C
LSTTEGSGDLDIIVDNAVVDTIRRAKRAEPGPEDIIAYVRARESEVQVLRVALLGKMAGLDSATLHRRMRASLL